MFISMNTQIGILCVLCVLLGVMVGLFMARATIRGAKKSGALRIESASYAPAPVDLGYDPSLYINGGSRKTVEKCGYKWTVMNGYEV